MERAGHDDHEATLAFYGELMGWGEKNTHDMGMGVYRIYGTPDSDHGGMDDLAPGSGTPPAWLMYVMVPDVDEVAEKVTHLGGTVINGPMDVPGGGRVAQCLDPSAPPARPSRCTRRGADRTTSRVLIRGRFGPSGTR